MEMVHLPACGDGLVRQVLENYDVVFTPPAALPGSSWEWDDHMRSPLRELHPHSSVHSTPNLRHCLFETRKPSVVMQAMLSLDGFAKANDMRFFVSVAGIAGNVTLSGLLESRSQGVVGHRSGEWLDCYLQLRPGTAHLDEPSSRDLSRCSLHVQWREPQCRVRAMRPLVPGRWR